MKRIKFFAIGIIAVILSLPVASNAFVSNNILSQAYSEGCDENCTAEESCVCTNGNSDVCNQCCQYADFSEAAAVAISDTESDCCCSEICEVEDSRDCCK